jgi:phasin family protein
MTEYETAQKKVGEFAAEAQKTMQDGVEKMNKGMEEAATFGQENFEALVESSRIAAKAAETLNAGLIAFSKKSYEDGLAAAKELTSCKSVTEFFEKQTAYTKSAVDAFMGEATRMNGLVTGATKDALEPISARMAAAADMVKSARV